MYNPDIHHRRSIRLREYDYADAGGYFVTICTYQRHCLFGEVVAGEMRLNEAGQCVEKWWQSIPEHFENTSVDSYVIMPNHFHGVIMHVGAGSPRPVFQTNEGRETTENQGGDPENRGGDPQNQGGETPPLRYPTLGQVVGYFKYQSTRQINELRDNPGCPVWQRNYHEHIVRNENDLLNIRRYITENPLKWEQDENNPANFAS